MKLKATRQKRREWKGKKSKNSPFILSKPSERSLPEGWGWPPSYELSLKLISRDRYLRLHITQQNHDFVISQVQNTVEFLTFFLGRSLEDMINLLAELVVYFKLSSMNNAWINEGLNSSAEFTLS